LLLELRERFGIEIVAAHFDHQLRPESRADLEFVRALCDRLGVTCLTGEGDVRSLAAERKVGIEDAARRMRYQFLAFVAGKEDAGCVATGHTADDQAETVLMRVVRGTGIRGVRGMLPVSDVPGAPSHRLVRPLLGLTRRETMAICSEAGVVPLADPMNEDVVFARSRIRHETLATLRAVNPSVDRALIGLAESAQELFGPVEKLALGCQPQVRGPDGSIFALSDVAVLPNEALMLLIERESTLPGLETEVNRTRVRNLRGVLARGAGEVAFGEAVVEVSAGKVRVGPHSEGAAEVAPKMLNVPGTTVAGVWRMEVATEEGPPSPGAIGVAIDSAALKGVLRVRSLAPGDRMTYAGLSRKVADVLANAKVPRWERRALVAIADGSGVVAVLGGEVALGRRPPIEAPLWVRISRLAAKG